MHRHHRLAIVFSAVASFFSLTSTSHHATAADSVATTTPIAVGEISDGGVAGEQQPENVRAEAERQIKMIDASQLPSSKRYVVSLALTRNASPTLVACRVNAMLRDARTGAMIAIIETGAHAEGPSSAELRKQVTHAALRSAVQRIPRALGAK